MDLPDIVYLVNGSCSGWRNQELKYSLRSLEKFGRNYGEVYIIGDKPIYLNNRELIHIPKEDSPIYCKERRIMEKLLHACRTPEISNPFVFFNDDFFLIKEIDFSNLPYFYNELIESKVIRRVDDTYRRSMKNTYDALRDRDLPTFHFDIHYPMYYDKEKFPEIMGRYDWDVRSGYIIKSLYANTLKAKKKQRPDCKIKLSHSKKEIFSKIEPFDMFSTAEISRAMVEILNQFYPKESKFEKV